MPEAIKAHVLRQKIVYILSVLSVAVVLGIYLSLLAPWRASAAVSAVSGSDVDTTGNGLDGRDVKVNWTVSGDQPAGFQGYMVFVAASTTVNLWTAANVTSTGCAGGVCSDVGFFGQYQQNNATLPQFRNTDSAGAAWVANAGHYKAAVLQLNSNSALNQLVTSSAAFGLTSDTVADTNPPQIDHLNASQATANQNATIHAFIRDDQTVAENFHTNEGEPEFFNLVYGADVSVASTTVGFIRIEGDLFYATVPSATVGNATFEYYIHAKDRAGNVQFFCGNPTASSHAACGVSPILVRAVAAGSRSLSGTISSGGSGLPSARVFLGGYATTSVATASGGSAGQYTIPGLPGNIAVDITAYKSEYCDNSRFEVIGSSDLTAVDFNIVQGNCGFVAGAGGGGGGGGGAPQPTFSVPFDGSSNAPLNTPVRVGFNQPLSASTANDANAADSGSNVYLTTDDGTTKIAGSVSFCESSSSAGCSALPSGDTNVLIFIPAGSLSTSTFYTLVITEGVISNSGQSIQGNRTGGGHTVSFGTVGQTFASDAFATGGTFAGSFGTGGGFMPPYVKSMIPAPGLPAAPNTDVLLEFNEALDSTTINSTNITLTLVGGSAVTLTSISLDTSEKRFVSIDPGTLSAGTYELGVLGAVKSAKGISMRSGGTGPAFAGKFTVSGSNDSTAPTIFPAHASGATIPVNEPLSFGVSEQLAFATVNSTNITISRGATSVAATIKYDAGANEIKVIPSSALAPNTAYTVSLSASVTDLAGNALTAVTFSYTSGAVDSTAPEAIEARCDDYSCLIKFNELMNFFKQTDGWGTRAFGGSVLNSHNWTLTQGGADKITTTTPITWDSVDFSVKVENVQLTRGTSFTLTAGPNIKDLSGNGINTASNANVFTGTAENSTETFGSFGGGGGMFKPPTTALLGAGSTIGGASMDMSAGGGFGDFTPRDFLLGNTCMANPFNQTAGADVGVFHIECKLDTAIQNNDSLVITFPKGTTVTNAVMDVNSPLNADINGFGNGTIAATLSSANNSTREVTVALAVSGGTPGANDRIMLDLSKITNPSIPKGPGTSGYTAGIKLKRAGTDLDDKTTTPFFLGEAGSNRITLNLYASSTDGVAGANGSIVLFAGGPGLPGIPKTVTLTNGIISAVDGTATTTLHLLGLNDGDYFVGTEPSITLGGVDYIGLTRPEPVHVDSGTRVVTKNLILKSTQGTGITSAALTVKFVDSVGAAFNFGGKDIDIFAGGPGNFAVKKLTNVSASESGGYTLRLNGTGEWNVGIGPGMPKTQGSKPTFWTDVTPPAPGRVIVDGTSISCASSQPPGVACNSTTDTLTFTLGAATKCVYGKVVDGIGTGVANVQTGIHSIGFMPPTFTMTTSTGGWKLCVADYGHYEFEAWKDGLPPVFGPMVIEADGTDADSVDDIYFRGQQDADEYVVVTISVPDYTISGKVLDASNNAVAGAFVVAADTTGQIRNSTSGSDGSYSVGVGNGTWTLRVELPPDSTSVCGTYSKTVTVSGSSQASQNITPTGGTCVKLAGTVSVGGSALTSIPVCAAEWDTTNDRPVFGGVFRCSATDGTNGTFSMNVVPSKNYQVGYYDSTNGENFITALVTTTDYLHANLTTASTGVITFSFTGGETADTAYIELKLSTAAGKRIGFSQDGLASSVAKTVPAGTYNYFISVPGKGDFTGSVATGNTATITLSAANAITGTVQDASGNALEKVAVTALNTTNATAQTTVTNSSGAYTLRLKSGTYTVTAVLSGYATVQQTATFSAPATLNFTGATNGLTKSTVSISGVVYKSDGSTPVTKGFVWATDANNKRYSSPVATDGTGTYNLPVVAGTYSVKAMATLHAETTCSSSVVVAGSSQTVNCTLTADTSNTLSSETKGVAANVGGTIDATTSSSLKMTIGAGALVAGSTDNVSISIDTTNTGPDTTQFNSLKKKLWSVDATGQSGAVKELAKDVDMELDYSDIVSSLPSGVSESDLKAAYYSEEKGDYILVEGGYTVDSTNNKITLKTDHFTSFSIVYVPPAAAAASTPSASTPAGSGGGGAAVAPIAPSAPSSPAAGATASPTAVPASDSRPSAAPAPVKPTPPAPVAVASIPVAAPTPVSVGGVSHTVTVGSVSEDKSEVTLTIKSEPVTVTLKAQESKSVDTNGDGISDLRVTFSGVDEAGNPNLSFASLADATEINKGLTINAGSYETASREATLSFNVANVKYVKVSNDKDLNKVSYKKYEPTMSWTLSEGNGDKVVYVRFKSVDGALLDVNDSITLTGQSFDAKKETKAAPKKTTAPSTGCALTKGAAYKTADSSAVWYITDSCTRRPFKSPKKFFTYFTSWNEVQTADKATLHSLPVDNLGFMPWGKNYDPQYGALVKIVSDPKVYLLLGAQRFWINSEQVFNTLGYAWNWIEDISSDLLAKYSLGSEITVTTRHPNYTLVKYANSSKVYRLEPSAGDASKQVKRHIKNQKAFDALGFRLDRIVTIDAGETYDNGDALDETEAASTKGKADQPAASSAAGAAEETPVAEEHPGAAGAYTYDFVSDLRLGSESQEVRNLQTVLVELGYMDHAPTGYYGGLTVNAVKWFQREMGLSQVGVVGAQTREKLNAL